MVAHIYLHGKRPIWRWNYGKGWDKSDDPMEVAKERVHAAFEFMEKCNSILLLP